MKANTKKLMSSFNVNLIYIALYRWKIMGYHRDHYQTEFRIKKTKIIQGKDDSINVTSFKKYVKFYKETEKFLLKRVLGKSEAIKQKLIKYHVSFFQSIKKDIVTEIRQLKFI